MRELKSGEGEAWSSIALDEETARDRRFGIHPILLDGCLQTVTAALSPDADPRCALSADRCAALSRLFVGRDERTRPRSFLKPDLAPGAPVLRANVNLYGAG